MKIDEAKVIKKNTKITLDPLYYLESSDKLEIEFKENELIITASVDNTGNTFKIKKEDLKRFL